MLQHFLLYDLSTITVPSYYYSRYSISTKYMLKYYVVLADMYSSENTIKKRQILKMLQTPGCH